mmetsp:Transcript_23096/g.46329  ORF Transcript_23096/g.46329 Transcript_23096/m.46329 type:complete len:237 (-) Transcript_23096:637-1347(-)
MHSRRVGFLKMVFSASLYLGLTNSGTMPFDFSRVAAYSGMEKMRMLRLPGYGEKPEASASSPAYPAAFIRASSWLYSTLQVRVLSLLSSLQMAPTASPGLRGTVMELTSNSSVTDTPKAAGAAWKTSPLVSWKNMRYLRPSEAHFLARPASWMSLCTSPWPWGLVCSEKALSFCATKAASLLAREGTFSCFTITTCPSAMPKLLFFFRRSTVLAWVSPLVMMASGSTQSVAPALRA